MKMFFIILGLLLGSTVYAGAPGTLVSVIRDTSVTDVPTTFTDADAAFMTGLNHKSNILVVNGGAADIEVCLSAKSAAGCSATNLFYVPAGAGVGSDAMVIGELVFVRSRGAAISSGIIDVKVW